MDLSFALQLLLILACLFFGARRSGLAPGLLGGTGHVVYTMLPIIYDVAIKNGVRPERPMAAAAIASQMGIIAARCRWPWPWSRWWPSWPRRRWPAT